MKKLILILAILLLTPLAMAQDEAKLTLKQGFLYLINDSQVRNFTCVQVIETKPYEPFGRWNMLWDGWVVDAGAYYDADRIDMGAVMIGRKLGTLGNYLPLNFPLKDKLDITIYPIGLAVRDMFDSPELQPAMGGAFVRLDVRF